MRYEITLTLKPMMYCHTAREQHSSTKKLLWELLEPYHEVSMICELTSMNNCHYHGLIELRDHQERDKLINRIRRFKQLGKFTINQVKYEQSYIEYMRKDMDKTRDIVGDPIVKDMFGLYGMRFHENPPVAPVRANKP